MKVLLVALAFLFPPDGSLGIGIDVLPEAFTFAARRVGYNTDLRLTACTTTYCTWDLGGGIQLTAEHSDKSLDVYRLEATHAPSDVDAVRYEKTCLAIFALVDHDTSPRYLLETLRRRTSPGSAERRVRVEGSDGSISLFIDLSDSIGIRRCGANAT